MLRKTTPRFGGEDVTNSFWKTVTLGVGNKWAPEHVVCNTTEPGHSEHTKHAGKIGSRWNKIMWNRVWSGVKGTYIIKVGFSKQWDILFLKGKRRRGGGLKWILQFGMQKGKMRAICWLHLVSTIEGGPTTGWQTGERKSHVKQALGIHKARPTIVWRIRGLTGWRHFVACPISAFWFWLGSPV